MLPRDRRLCRSTQFRAVQRGGSRAGSATVVVHAGPLGQRGPARAGFIVGRPVGGSVVRHRVVRRLRHLVAGMLDEVPEGWAIVVRALPASATAPSGALRADLAGCLRRAVARRTAREAAR